MKGLVFHRAGKAEVATCRPERIVGRSEDGRDNLAHELNFEQHLPFRPVQLAAGEARTAEGIAVRPTVAGAALVQLQDFGGHLVASLGEDLDLLPVQDIGDDHEAVATKELNRTPEVLRLQNFQTLDAVFDF